MNRRELLQQVGAILGGAVVVPNAYAVLGGCRPGRCSSALRTLTAQQNEIITTICEMIIPQTDTPGATAARVNEFIDLILTDWFEQAERTQFLAGFAELESTSMRAFDHSFMELSQEQKTRVLTQLDSQSAKLRLAVVQEPTFFSHVKELTLVGYYTSEIGTQSELVHLPAVARFEACAELEKVGGPQANPIRK